MATIPTDLAQLQAMMAAGTLPGMLPQLSSVTQQVALPPAAPIPRFVTDVEVKQLIDARLAELPPPAAPPVTVSGTAVLGALLERALPQSEHAAIAAYFASGMPGLDAMLNAGKLNPIAELLWETIKENK